MSKMDSSELIDMAVPAYYASKLFDRLRNSIIVLSEDESANENYDILKEYKNELMNQYDSRTMKKYAEEEDCIKEICRIIMGFYKKQNMIVQEIVISLQSHQTGKVERVDMILQ